MTVIILSFIVWLSSFLKWNDWITRFLGVLLVTYSYYLGWWNLTVFSHGAYQGIAYSIPIGIGLFVVSFIFTTPHLKHHISLMRRGLSSIQCIPLLNTIFVVAGLTAAYEECVWRVCIQSGLIPYFGAGLSITTVAAAFTLLHIYRFKSNPVRLAEFWIFSVSLGLVFYMTQSYWIVMMIHFIRNALTVVYRFSILQSSSQEQFV